MSDPVRFLGAFAQALTAMGLYAEGHPSRERASEAAHQALADLQADRVRHTFTFLGDEIIHNEEPLRALAGASWARRLAAVGVQRMEVDDRVPLDDFGELLSEIHARFAGTPIDTREARQMRRSAIRFGSLGLRQDLDKALEIARLVTPALSLDDETAALRSLHNEIAVNGVVALADAETVVESLAIAMHSGQRALLPLLDIKEFDQYTTTHSMNVAVLSMGLAETLALPSDDVRDIGIAGLLHDLGKIRIPIEILTKPGALTKDERELMNRHPVEGARLLLEVEDQLDVAATVAYEHHIMLNGGGYPSFRYRRDCHVASRLVHVCDVYDALRTRRPYREAWQADRILAYLSARAGSEFDPAMVEAFARMMRDREPTAVALAEPAGDQRLVGASGFEPLTPAV